MKTKTPPAPLPAAAAPSVGPGRFQHLRCCAPDRAVCGARINPMRRVGREGVFNPCPICQAFELLNGPCDVKGCPQ
jgi:hypothetical protein